MFLITIIFKVLKVHHMEVWLCLVECRVSACSFFMVIFGFKNKDNGDSK